MKVFVPVKVAAECRAASVFLVLAVRLEEDLSLTQWYYQCAED